MCVQVQDAVQLRYSDLSSSESMLQWTEQLTTYFLKSPKCVYTIYDTMYMCTCTHYGTMHVYTCTCTCVLDCIMFMCVNNSFIVEQAVL